MEMAEQPAGGEVSDNDVVPPDVLAAMNEWMAAREREWLDEPIPALGGMTPRAAASDPKRRRELVALLREWDQVESRRGMNTARIRELLGLDV
jgi:hypothetical protein